MEIPKEYPQNRLIILWTNKTGEQKWRDYTLTEEEKQRFWNYWKEIRPQQQR